MIRHVEIKEIRIENESTHGLRNQIGLIIE